LRSSSAIWRGINYGNELMSFLEGGRRLLEMCSVLSEIRLRWDQPGQWVAFLPLSNDRQIQSKFNLISLDLMAIGADFSGLSLFVWGLSF